MNNKMSSYLEIGADLMAVTLMFFVISLSVMRPAEKLSGKASEKQQIIDSLKSVLEMLPKASTGRAIPNQSAGHMELTLSNGHVRVKYNDWAESSPSEEGLPALLRKFEPVPGRVTIFADAKLSYNTVIHAVDEVRTAFPKSTIELGAISR